MAEEIIVCALYHFAPLDEMDQVRQSLIGIMDEHGIMGTLILAKEGINGTVSGPYKGLQVLLRFIRAIPGFEDLISKESVAHRQPFLRRKVKIKKEIVTLGVKDIQPVRDRGQYVEPKDWNALISRKDVQLIDTRNSYETLLGTFQGAVDPCTSNFREFPKWAEENLAEAQNTGKSIAMYCTGGIRCEKSTSLLRKMGFQNVYHLQGGILKYLEEIPPEESLWQGECYVFDERVGVDNSLQPSSTWTKCRGCRWPITTEDMKDENYIEGVQCPRCHDKRSTKSIERARARHAQIAAASK